jgi:predicted nucleic acid-binding protein
MNVVDSSAWLSYFTGDKNARLFAKPIENIDELLVPSITIVEVFKIVLRQRNEESALEVIAHMEQGLVIDLDTKLAVNAGVYGVELNLPLADSIIYATATMHNAIVWTQDDDFEGLDGVRFYPKAIAT